MTFREIMLLESLDKCIVLAKSVHRLIKRKRKRYDDILVSISTLKDYFKQVQDTLPDNETVNDRKDAFWRHMWFVERFLGKEKHHLSIGNIEEIYEIDLPMIKDAVTEEIKRNPVVHPEFYKHCGNLVSTGEYSSAIKEGFLLVKQLAHHKFPRRVNSLLDGQNLMDELFKVKGGCIRIHKEEDKQRAFQDWAKSLYALFRNDEMHNIIRRPLYDVECILMSINRLLFAIEEA